MPNQKVDSIKINDFGEMKDKRRKLTAKDKEDIRNWYATGTVGTRPIAKAYGVSRRLIMFIVDPEKREANVRARNARGGSSIYYDREQHTKAIADLRKRKKELLKNEDT